MPGFNYTAIEAATGRKRTGTIESPDTNQAVADLKAQSLHPTALQPAAARAHGVRGIGWTERLTALRRPGTSRQRALFTRQLAALLRAGLPLVRGLDLLARQERHAGWRDVISGLSDRIRAGDTLAAALAERPRIFDRLYRGIVAAGESGGSLDAALDRLARHLEKSEHIRARVRSAMVYPLVILLVASAVVGALVVFVVPRFEAIFAGVLKGAPLPALTQTVLAASRMAQAHWPWLVAGGVLGCWGARWLPRTPAGARMLDRVSFCLPVWGALRLKTIVARFSRALGSMLASGVPILEALQLTRDACGSWSVGEALGMVQGRVREGEGVARPLDASGLFPPVVAGMVEVGEETGNLPAMLSRLAELYEDEVETAVGALTSLIEPAMIVLMAVVVGTIVVALFLPIVRIIQMLG